MEPVAPPARDDQDLRAAVPAEFRAVTARLHFEFLNELDRGADDDPVDEPVVVIHSVEQEIVGGFARAVEMQAARALRRELRAGGRRCAPRRQQSQLKKLPAVEGKVQDVIRVDQRPERRRPGLKEGRVPLHGYDLLDRAYL